MTEPEPEDERLLPSAPTDRLIFVDRPDLCPAYGANLECLTSSLVQVRKRRFTAVSRQQGEK